MSTQTELFTAPDPTTQIRQFSPADTAIAAMAKEYMPLKIDGINDKVGFAAVHSARMVVRQHRIEVEKKRKELKADALKYGQAVDAEARRIAGLLEPIETHLECEENRIEEEKAAIRNAVRLKAEAEAKAKADAEAAKLKAEQEAENARLAAERAKLDAERKAMEAERAKQRVEQEKIDAEKLRIEREVNRLALEKAKRDNAAAVEKARKEAAEKARIETEQRIAREQAEREAAEKAREEAKEVERKRAEALRPDREKLLAVVISVRHILVPEVSENAKLTAIKIRGILTDTAKRIRIIIDADLPGIKNVMPDLVAEEFPEIF